MKIPVNLLKQYSSVSISPEELVSKLKDHVGEVEDHHNLETDYKDIVIAEIKEKSDHPDADKLGVYKLDLGNGNLIQVLAGDKTLEVGDKVAYLKVGAVVPYSIYTEEKPFVIKAVNMRGLESNGMMGSEKELNLGPDHTKVMRLPKDAPVGEDFGKYFELNDTVIDIENKALTNRGDLFGILGMTREVCAITNTQFNTPEWYEDYSNDLKPEETELPLSITNDAENLCPRYVGIAMDNVTIKESPVWLKSILIKCGIKPISNIVDITNYLSAIAGQPLHAFDYDKVLKNDPNAKDILHINVRLSRAGERILALNDKLYELNDKTIVIADSTNPIAIAGTIGGKDTEVDENTKRIVFECAMFDKTSIRRTSMYYGLFTDASTIYKHALDTQRALPIINKAVEMARELSGATVASSIIDIQTEEYIEKVVSLSMSKLNEHLGTSLSKEIVLQILNNLGYEIVKDEEDIISVKVPTWRRDVNIKEDIHEDIGRIYGYNNIEMKLPQKDITPSRGNIIFETKKKIRTVLANSGANEIDTYNFIDIDVFKKCNMDPELAFKVKNALSPELSLMRTSLIPSILVKVKENLQRGFGKFMLYEFNIPHQKGNIDENNLPKESWYLSSILVDNQKDIFGSAYYTMKKYLEKILHTLNIKDIEYRLVADTTEQDLPIQIKNLLGTFDPNVCALVVVNDQILGIMGEFKKDVVDNFKLPEHSAGLEININSIVELEVEEVCRYTEMPKFPASTQDLCFSLNSDIHYDNVRKDIEKIVNRGDLWGEVECIDIFQKDENQKKVTFRITIRDYNKTLAPKDIKELVEKIQSSVEKKYEAKIA